MRVILELPQPAALALVEAAVRDRRPAGLEALVLVEEALRRRGLLRDDSDGEGEGDAA